MKGYNMDRRVQKTKAAIRDAYFSLLKEEQNRKISITSIAKRANIDRKTFYLHYETIEDIIEEFYQEIATNLVSRLKAEITSHSGKSIVYLFTIFNETLEENMDYFGQFTNLPEYSDFFDQLSTIIVDTIVENCWNLFPFNKDDLRYYTTFYISGIVSVYTLWNKQGRDKDTEQLAAMLKNASIYGIKYLIESC